jgi:hypothetical protein
VRRALRWLRSTTAQVGVLTVAVVVRSSIGQPDDQKLFVAPGTKPSVS